jgi:hypothetical protein
MSRNKSLDYGYDQKCAQYAYTRWVGNDVKVVQIGQERRQISHDTIHVHPAPMAVAFDIISKEGAKHQLEVLRLIKLINVLQTLLACQQVHNMINELCLHMITLTHKGNLTTTAYGYIAEFRK